MSADMLDGSGATRLVKARHGYMMYNANDTGIGRTIGYYGEYFEAEIELLSKVVVPGDVVLDVGANIGTHTLPFARLVGDGGLVVAVEPTRLVYQMLCGNVALNGLENIDCVHAALGSETGVRRVLDFSLREELDYGAVSIEHIPGNVELKIFSLDDFFRYSKLKLIKLDVEGMELAVLQGGAQLLARMRPILYLDNDRLQRSRDLLGFLEQMNYTCYWHFPLQHSPDNFFQKEYPLDPCGFVDLGATLSGRGFSVNILAIPTEFNADIRTFHKVLNVDEHPFRRECNARFLTPA